MKELTGPALWWRLLLIGALWGASFPLLRHAAQSMSPFAIATARGAIAALAVLAFLAATGALRGLGGRMWRHALVIGTTNGWIPNVLTAMALGRIEAAPAALIQASAPLLVAVIASAVIAAERPGPRGALGLLIGFAGIAIVIGPGAFGARASLEGAVLMLVAALSYAIGTVYARVVRPGAAAPLVVGQQVVSAGAAGLLMIPFDSAASFSQPASVWLAVVLLGVFASALPLTMFLSILQRAKATEAASVGYLQPVFAALIAAVWLAEWPEPRVLAGGAVVLAGVWLATSRR